MNNLENDNRSKLKLYHHIRRQNRERVRINIEHREWENAFSRLIKSSNKETVVTDI